LGGRTRGEIPRDETGPYARSSSPRNLRSPRLRKTKLGAQLLTVQRIWKHWLTAKRSHLGVAALVLAPSPPRSSRRGRCSRTRRRITARSTSSSASVPSTSLVTRPTSSARVRRCVPDGLSGIGLVYAKSLRGLSSPDPGKHRHAGDPSSSLSCLPWPSLFKTGCSTIPPLDCLKIVHAFDLAPEFAFLGLGVALKDDRGTPDRARGKVASFSTPLHNLTTA